jgi:hypothetical protein
LRRVVIWVSFSIELEIGTEVGQVVPSVVVSEDFCVGFFDRGDHVFEVFTGVRFVDK